MKHSRAIIFLFIFALQPVLGVTAHAGEDHSETIDPSLKFLVISLATVLTIVLLSVVGYFVYQMLPMDYQNKRTLIVLLAITMVTVVFNSFVAYLSV